MENEFFKKSAVECLMVEVDGKRLFTQKKSAPLLVEWAKKYSASFSIVKAKSICVFPIKNLIDKLKENYTEKDASFQILERYQFGEGNTTLKIEEKNIVIKSDKEIIKELVKNMFVTKKPVSILKISDAFPHLKQSSIRYYVKKAKEEVEEQGYKVVKIAKGVLGVLE